MDKSAIKLRVIEALTRTDGSPARNNPKEFIKVVAQLVDFVVEDQPSQTKTRRLSGGQGRKLPAVT